MYNNTSIIIPAFNEQLIIFKSINKLIKWKHDNSLKFDIIVVDDGSTDNTQKILKSYLIIPLALWIMKNSQLIIK